MITIIKATKPSRKRDKGRLILRLSGRMYHLTSKEIANLRKALQ